jgi:two-component system, chemotaxis family, protein-glutamate methylesterase/glutaminase
MPAQHVVVIGASAGGVEALLTLARGLRPGLPAAICIVLHQPRNAPSVMPKLMSRAGDLTVVHAEHDMALEAGRVYLAPPNQHLLIERGRLRLDHGPLENGHRPAVDPLFRSAAASYGSAVTAVVLSGSLDDGAAGCVLVKRTGGSVVVQDPDDALYGEMPRAAMQAVGAVDAVVTISGLIEFLDRLRLSGAVDQEPSMDECPEDPSDPEGSAERQPDLEHPVHLRSLSCPSCGGSLHEERDEDGESIQEDAWRCRVGHGWSLDSLFAQQGDAAEAALWAAVRVLEERSALCRRLRNRAHERGQARAVESFARQAHEAERHARSIRASIRDLVPLLGRSEPDGGLPVLG